MPRRPLDGSPTITQVWGEPSKLYRKGYHTGVDYGVGNGTAIKAPANGVVSVGDGRAETDGRGFFIRVTADDGVEHLMYHLARWHVSSGRVTEGQHIADSDNTGLSTGAHLHWETRRNGVDFNPADWLYATPPAPVPTPAPTPSIAPNQRVLENKDGVYQRAEPKKSATIIKDWPYDAEPFSFKAFVRGEDPYGNGNNIWFVGQYSGGYFWSGAFLDKGTHDLPDQTPSPTPLPAPTPTPIPPTPTPEPEMPLDFKPDDATVIATYKTLNQGVVDANGKTDRTKTQTPKFIVIHQWDDPAKKPTREGVIAHFQDPKVEVSAHYIVDNSGVYQMVPENKRAWHAGPSGNDGIGIECDPNGTDAMYAHLRLLVANIRVRWNRLELKKHSDFMSTQCPKYIEVLRIEPVTVPPNSTTIDQENNAMLKKLLAMVTSIYNYFKGQFKTFQKYRSPDDK